MKCRYVRTKTLQGIAYSANVSSPHLAIAALEVLTATAGMSHHLVGPRLAVTTVVLKSAVERFHYSYGQCRPPGLSLTEASLPHRNVQSSRHAHTTPVVEHAGFATRDVCQSATHMILHRRASARTSVSNKMALLQKKSTQNFRGMRLKDVYNKVQLS